ncbi:hypothetical protein FBALC1_12342 [Flavobacteriales bacterium ALC-1]|nr:hypothetical protein FBALC1_12342 [Flavobacteriales bacterium ALC-1]
MENIKNVLWTGGWDSTFRVIQLYRLGATIQTIYIIDQKRKSSNKEIEVINSLAEKTPLHFNQSNGHILPIKYIKRENIPYNLFLKVIHKILRRQVGLGKQYYWLASFAQKHKNLDVSFHKEDLDKFFSEEQLIEIKDDNFGSNWKINPKKVGFLRRQLFKNMTFPLITVTKPEMKFIAEENNFIELMELTWFCHKSTDKPCGKCAPCKQYVRDGFGYRLQ